MDKTLNELLVPNSKKSKKELIEICLNYYKNKNDSLCKETNFLVSNICSAMRKIDILLKSHNKKIEVINLVDSNKEDLIQDFVSVITSFCARIYGQRRSKRKTEKLIKELEDESKENS